MMVREGIGLKNLGLKNLGLKNLGARNFGTGTTIFCAPPFSR
jgi:hypothetical protein